MDQFDDEIVISGISGRFPESSNMTEFRDNLLNHNNLVTVNERRFKPKIYGIPEGFGCLKELDKFDAEFFRVFPAQASRMDPQLRMTLETTFEAMQDAGVNPNDERESRIGVFYGVCFSEANILWNAQASKVEGAAMTGCSLSMFANRISYAFDFNGPSFALDTACSSSIVALEAAVSSIRSGKCDAAIVTASSLILSPHTTLQFQKLGMLSPESTCKSFDASGNGYVRSEAQATIFLQKKSVAKRAYASILHVKTNTDGFKDVGITYPSTAVQTELLREVYDEAGVDTDQVIYLECHGTGTAAGDPLEISTISHTFFNDQTKRNGPLYIGSVKSNMGHSEAASGLCGIAKIVIAIQEGIIPGNLHFEKPHYSMKAIRDGKIKVVDENTKLLPGLISLNSFGFGGVNCHAILKPFGNRWSNQESEHNSKNKASSIPKIVIASGRTEEGLRSTLKAIAAHDNSNFNNLVNESFKTIIPGHGFRGFSLPDQNMTRVESLDKESSNLWFVFNGMGSQWTGMGLDLMKIQVFAQSIENSANTLMKEFQFDLMALLNQPELPGDPTTTFVSVAAIQIGIVDVLSSLGLRPTGIIGHSAGEMLCAYADGCLSAEETIKCAYFRGNSLGNMGKEGSHGMAVIGDSWEHVSRRCPEGIYPACHNGLDSVTVSGPTELLASYIAEVKSKKRIAKKVNSCGIAFHSPYIDSASKNFLGSLKSLVENPKVRSKRWISTSVLRKDWASESATTACPEYFNNNFRSPVLFYDALKEIPENSTIVEIGPSGLLKGLIKKAVPSATVIAVQSRDSKNGLVDFMTALGSMYLAGVEIDVNKLYGDIEFPVPLGTPMLSPLINWDHETSWDVPVYGKNGEFLECIFDIDMSNEKEYYLLGHQLQNRVLFPATGYLELVWKCFAQMHQTDYEHFPVVFENVRFSRVTVLRESAKIEFRINISDLSGNFEVKEGGGAIATGTIRRPADFIEFAIDDYTFAENYKKQLNQSENETRFIKNEIYKQLRFSGYEYSGIFKGVRNRDESGKYFNLDWNNNWVAFLDTCLQTALGIFEVSKATELPTEIQKLVISPQDFLEFVQNNETSIKDNGIFVFRDKETDLIRCKGIEISGFKTTAVGGSSSKRESPVILSPYKFFPFNMTQNDPKNQIESVCPIIQCVTIIMENIKSSLVTTVPEIIEITQHAGQTDSLQISKLIREDFATVDINYNLYSDDCPPEIVEKLSHANISTLGVESINDNLNMVVTEQKFDILITDNHLLFRMALDYVRKGGFLLFKCPLGKLTKERVLEKLGGKYTLIVYRETETHQVLLARKNMNNDKKNIQVLPISSRDLSWVTKLRDLIIEQEQMITEKKKAPLIYLISNGEEEDDSGIMGLILCIRKEPFGQNFRAIFSRKKIELDFNNPNELLQEILVRDLAYTVVNFDGTFGSYIHSPLETQAIENSKHVFLGMETIGDLATLRWVQGFNYNELARVDGYVPVDVKVSPLNFKDIMLSSGNLQPDKRSGFPFTMESNLGFEFAGVSSEGNRVFGFSEGQALATSIFANRDWIWNIPKHWSFEEASTIPVVYLTSYLALVMRGQIQEGESILIHAGAGGVGLAAIQIALSFKCRIFTTVGSKEKIAFLRKTFPEIPESHIGFSRDTSFEQMVRSLTKGRGVDLVLNSLSGVMLEASVRCLARHGRFLEIGKVDLVSNKALGMSLFLKDASYHGVMLDSLWDANPQTRRQLNQLLQNGLDTGVVRPLPYRVFSHEQVEPAFRYLAQGRHIGKVLVTFESAKTIPSVPRVYFNPNKSYIIIGGVGGVGLEFVNWMTTRYARNIVLTTRSGIKSAYQKEYIRIWESQGIKVKVLQLDASDINSAKILLEEAKKMGPVGGFFNLAMLLDVGLMKTQSEDAFAFVMSCKNKLTMNLDILTRKSCPSLDHFVVFSSVAAGFGFDGQANYGQANSAIERIVEKRCREGFPGKAIQWGPIGEVGGWHDGYNTDFTVTSFHGSGVQSIASALASLDILLKDPSPVILSRRTVPVEAGVAGGKNSLGVIDRIAHILGHTAKKLNPNAKLTELGMDSVMSMEVRQILEQDFTLFLTAVEIRGSTLKQLEDMANNSSKNKMIAPKIKSQPATQGLFQLNFIKTMSRGRFTFHECVFPVNEMAEKRFKQEKKEKSPSIFIINSVEGPDVLKLLGSLLNLPTYSMQMATDAPMGNMPLLQEYYFNHIKAVEPEGPYVIVGYSAGVFAGIELALRFEKLGEITKLVLLDMSPARFRAILEENFGPDRTNLDATDILITMMSQIFGLDRYEIEGILRKEPTVEQRIEKVKEVLEKVFDEKMDVDVLTSLISDKAKTFLYMFDSYVPTGVLEGKVVLVKTTQNLISYDSYEFWGVDEFCKQKPIVQIMDTTHSYLLTEPTVRIVATTINND